MPRSNSPYGAPGYRRGTGLKVGRSVRRQRSFLRTYLLLPLLGLFVVAAGALVVSVAVNFVQGPSGPQATGGTPAGQVTNSAGGAGTSGGGSGSGPGGAPAGQGQGGSAGATGTGRAAGTGKTTRAGSGSGAGPKTGARTGAKTGSKGAKGGAKGTKTSAHGKTAGAGGGKGGALALVASTAGTDTYVAPKGPLVATLHVAWPSWVRVLADGKLAFLHLETTGFTRTFRGQRSLNIYLGYPQGSTLRVNGKTLGPFPGKSTLWVDTTVKAAG